MKTKVFSFRAPVDFVPTGISVKDFVFDLYDKAKTSVTSVNTAVDAGVNSKPLVKQSGGKQYDWSGFLAGLIIGSIIIYAFHYLPMKEKYEKELKIKGIVL